MVESGLKTLKINKILNTNKMERKFKITTADLKFSELCEEIDYWKQRAERAEAKAEEWERKYSKNLNDQLLESQKGIAQALMFAFNARDDENGNLIINKDKRDELAMSYKSE